MYQIKAVKKTKIHLMPSTLLFFKYKDPERNCQSQLRVFIINIMGDFFTCFSPKGPS